MSHDHTTPSNDELAALWRAHVDEALARLAMVRARRAMRRKAGNVIPFPTRTSQPGYEHD